MTYSINGIELNNKAYGWTLVRGSIPISGLEFTSPALDIPGVDGTVFLPSTRRPVSMTFIMKSTLKNRSLLLGLMSSPKLVITNSERPGMTATARLVTSTVDEHHEVLGWAKDTFVLEIPEGAWRGTTITTTKTAMAAGGVNHYPFTNLTGVVQDAQVIIRGPIQDPEVTDSSGAYFKLTGTVPAGQELIFHSLTGRAYVHTSPSARTEVSGQIRYGGPRAAFEITPKLPAMSGELRLTAASYSAGAGIQVKGKPVYLF